MSTTSSGVYPPSSLPGLMGGPRDRRSSTPHSETESGDCSEGEMSDLTPCNASPSLSQLLSWSGGCRRTERDDVEENWRAHVQTLMQVGHTAFLPPCTVLFSSDLQPG